MERSIKRVEANRRFLLPLWLRWACLLSALFIAYSEFVSVGLSSFKRGVADGPQNVLGSAPALYGVVSLFSPWHMVTVSEDAFLYRDVGAGILVAFAGCAGLWVVAFSRPHRTFTNAQIYALGTAGMAVPIVVKLYELTFGPWRRTGTNGEPWPMVHEPPAYPIYGYVELIGGLFYPLVVYFTLMVVLPVVNSSAGRHDSDVLGSPSAKKFLLAAWIRWSLLLLALFVGYSQLISAALTGYFRYDPMELSFIDGGSPKIFSAISFLEPLQNVATLAAQESARWTFSPFRDLLVAVVLTAFGTGGLVAAGLMHAGWRYPKLVLAIGCLFGITASAATKYYELAVGSLGLADHLTRSTSGFPINPIHPIYGYVELWGSLFVPIALYPVLLLGILVGAGQDLICWSRRHAVVR